MNKLKRVYARVTIKNVRQHSIEEGVSAKSVVARNSFVHEGVARIGKRNAPLTSDGANRLVQDSSDIIRFIKEKLPEELQWPVYNYSFQIDIGKRIWS